MEPSLLMTKSVDPNIIWMRAIACMAVVFVHTFSADSASAVYLATALNQLLRFGAPVLLFISAYLLYASPPPGSLRAWVRRRVEFVVLPFLAVSTLPITHYLLEQNVWKALSQLVTGGGTHLFFVPVLIQFYGLYLLSLRFLPRCDWPRMLLPALCVSLGWSGLMLWADVPVNRWQWLCPSWLVFYVLGAAVATDRAWLKRTWRQYGLYLSGALAVMVVVACVQLFAASFLTAVRVEILSTSRGPTLILYSVLVISLWVALWGRFPRSRLLGWLSSRSFGVYLLHPFVAQFAKFSLPGFGGLAPFWQFGAILVTTFFTVVVLERLPYGYYLVGKPGPTGLD